MCYNGFQCPVGCTSSKTERFVSPGASRKTLPWSLIDLRYVSRQDPYACLLCFEGGSQAFVSKLYVDATDMIWVDTDRNVEGSAWRWQDGLAFINDTPLGRVEGRKGSLVEAMVQHLSDVHAEVRVVPAVLYSCGLHLVFWSKCQRVW